MQAETDVFAHEGDMSITAAQIVHVSVASILEKENQMDNPSPPRPNWTQAPSWSNWWAVDPNGWAHWYQEEPIYSLTITYCGWLPKTIERIQQGAEIWAGEIDLPLGVDWRLLKEKRPE